MSEVVGRVTAIHRFPLKSMAGESLDAADVTPRGVLGDRARALVDGETGRVVSAKRPRRWPGILDCRASYDSPPRPGAPPPPVTLRLPDGNDLSSEAPDFDGRVSAALGRPVRLSTVAPDGASFEYHWPDMPGLVYRGREHRDEITVHEMPPGTFFDGSILHLLTTASLDEMRRRTPGSDFDASRFRPNFLIEPSKGAAGFVEDRWVGRELRIGAEVRIEITKRCLRCVMTTLPHGDLPKDPGVLRAAFAENEGHVGVNARVVRPGSVAIGDPLSLV